MKNLYKIILILILTSSAVHFDISAAGKRKWDDDIDNNPLCFKKSKKNLELHFQNREKIADRKRKAQEDTGNQALCLKRSHIYDKEQRQLDFDLFEATRTGNTRSVAALLAQNANPNALTSYYYERTPLHIAARNSNLDCIELLLQYGANVNSVIDHFLTPLHEAVCVFDRNSGVACIELLLQTGAKINAQNDKKNTPLHLAAMFCHHYYVEILLAWGADRTLRNIEGKTPLMVAEDKRFGAIIDLLKAQEKIEEMDIS